jgi:hypothetical protein
MGKDLGNLSGLFVISNCEYNAFQKRVMDRPSARVTAWRWRGYLKRYSFAQRGRLGPVRVPGICSAPLPKLKMSALKTKLLVLDMGAELMRCSAELEMMSWPPYSMTVVNGPSHFLLSLLLSMPTLLCLLHHTFNLESSWQNLSTNPLATPLTKKMSQTAVSGPQLMMPSL